LLDQILVVRYTYGYSEGYHGQKLTSSHEIWISHGFVFFLLLFFF